MNIFLKSTFRNLWKSKGYNALNIGGLAVGIACAALIFLWVEDELNFNRSFANRDTLYRVIENQTHDGTINMVDVTPAPLALALRTEMAGVKNATRMTGGTNRVLVSLAEKAFYEKGHYVDSTFLSMFTLHFIRGSAKHAFDQLQSLVITEKMAHKFFGESDPLGKTLNVDNELFTVTGVVEDLPPNTSFQFEWLAPFELVVNKFDWMKRWDANGVATFVQLQSPTSEAAVNEQLKDFLHSKNSGETRCLLFAMRDWHLYSSFTDGKQDGGGQIKYVKLFTVIAWITLFIACINFMNLATARSEQRAKEVGVRKSLGAEKKALVGQFLGETLVMALLAVVASIGIVYLSLPAFSELVEKQLALDFFNPLHFGGLLAIGFVCGVVAGSYPAFYLSSFNPVLVLKGLKSTTSQSAVLVRKGLVVTQFMVSTCMVICTVIIYQQIQHTKNRALGYQKENIIYLDVRGKMQEHFGAIKTALLNTGVVENATLSVNPVLQFGWFKSDNYSWPGKDAAKDILVTMEGVTPEYISTLGMKIKDGRDFFTDTKADENSILINESLARHMGAGSPVGIVISQVDEANLEDQWWKMKIVGVVEDFVFDSMFETDVPPTIMTCNPVRYNSLTIRFKDGTDLPAALAKVEGAMKIANPEFPFEYTFLDNEFDKLFKTETLIGKIAKVFAALAIGISCLGLFGLAAFTARRRKKEIGIRKVLGASASGMARLLSADFLLLVSIACLMAMPLAWWAMHEWLLQYNYHTPIHAWVFAATTGGVLLIALVTVSVQTLHAARANPTESLRSE